MVIVKSIFGDVKFQINSQFKAKSAIKLRYIGNLKAGDLKSENYLKNSKISLCKTKNLKNFH